MSNRLTIASLRCLRTHIAESNPSFAGVVELEIDRAAYRSWRAGQLRRLHKNDGRAPWQGQRGRMSLADGGDERRCPSA